VSLCATFSRFFEHKLTFGVLKEGMER
jgi:hypothetical protein